MNTGTKPPSDYRIVLLATKGRSSAQSRWIRNWIGSLDGAVILDLEVSADKAGARIANLASDGGKPVILVAQEEVCHGVASWAAGRRLEGKSVAGAVFICPKLPSDGYWERATGRLPFPSVIVGTRANAEAEFEDALALARQWGSQCVDGGDLHGVATARTCEWPYGIYVINWLWSVARPNGCREGTACY